MLTIDGGERIAVETPIDDVLDVFLGERGVGTKLAYNRVPFDADSLGPTNRLHFTTGPLQASRMVSRDV